MSLRVTVLHGVNMDVLEARPPEQYGGLTLPELEARITEFASEFDIKPLFYQTNHEGVYVEYLHRARDEADALIVNPGAWTHYSIAIRDALEIAALPTVEVHLSDIHKREPFRQVSVISDLCIATISGEGVDGYRNALQLLEAAAKQSE